MYNGTQHRYTKQNQKHLLYMLQKVHIYVHAHTGIQLPLISNFELNLQ